MHTEYMHHAPRCSGQTPGGGRVRPGVVWVVGNPADRTATPASLSLLSSEFVGGRHATRLNEGIGGTRGSATRSQIARSLLTSCVLSFVRRLSDRNATSIDKPQLVAGAHTCDSSDQHDAADEIELFETKRQHAQVQSPPPPRHPAHSDHSNAADVNPKPCRCDYVRLNTTTVSSPKPGLA